MRLVTSPAGSQRRTRGVMANAPASQLIKKGSDSPSQLCSCQFFTTCLHECQFVALDDPSCMLSLPLLGNLGKRGRRPGPIT